MEDARDAERHHLREGRRPESHGSGCEENGSMMKNASRLLRKLRRKVYREAPVATWNRVAEVNWRASYNDLISTFRRGDCGVLSGGAALALWRAATDAGFRAWCYDFGFPESLTHMVTVVELDGRLRVHDPFLNLEYRADFYEILEGLRADRLPDIRCETRDRKIYVMDPSCESQLTADWLTAHAERELDRVGSLRRFEVLWDRDALLATLARPEAVYRDLETCGYPADLSYLMLHPIGVFDGGAHHQNPETMPLIGGRDLRSPVAGLRAAMQQLTQDLAVERDQLAEKSTISGRLESELAEARSQLLATSGEAEQLSAQSAQLRAAIDESGRQWDAERQALSQGNSVLEERRAVLEAELAEATAHHAAATEEVRRLADQVVQLRSAYDDAERRITTERELFLQQQQKLEAALGETSAHAAAMEAQAQGSEQTIRTLQDAADQRTAEWEAERLVLQTAAQALEDDKQRLQVDAANTQADLVTAHGEIAELCTAFDRRAAEWEGERRSMQAAAQALEDEKRQLRVAATEAGEHLVKAQGQIAELCEAFDRRAAEWEGERRSLQEAAQALDDDKQQLQREVTNIRADLGNERAEIAELHDSLGRGTADWAIESQLLQDAAQILEGDAQRLREELVQTSAELVRAQTTAGEWRDRLDRRTAEWDDERQSLQASVQALDQETRYAFAASGAAQLRAEKAEAQATWADFRIAELVEKEAESEAAVSGIKRLIGVGDLPIDNLPIAVARLREHVRKLERELDRAEAERDRRGSEPRQGPARQASPAGRVGRYLRGLLSRRADGRGDLSLMKG
jgi:chromosome segregation ATPase